MGERSQLAGFPVVVLCTVRWGDMDAYQHVNNTVYLRYFEDARIAYFERTGIVGATAPVGPILASCSCRFRAPVTYPDTVHAATRVSALGEDRFTMEYMLYSERLGKLAASGEGVIVAYDYEARKKAPLPAAWREAIAKLEGTKGP